mmetsp:Transcript_14719/g.25043  ORF Transcript_14719/g.25043 Transcript_14719/m.25043 type:complete len:113 (-) Transcript_14719:648-986(-)
MQGERVLLLLHGVSGASNENYMLEMVGHASNRGYNCVVFNHYAPQYESDMRLINFADRRHMDEVIEYTKQKFDKVVDGKKVDCEIYMVGFSLGANYALRWLGVSGKEKFLDL